MNKQLAWAIAALFLLATIAGAFAAQNFNFQRNGDTVYIDDSKAYISAPYELRSQGQALFVLQTKTFTGNVNVVYGINSTIVTPKSAERYTTTSTTTVQSAQCIDDGSVPGQWYNYTLNPKHAWCWKNVTNENGTFVTPVWNRSFDSANISSDTIYYNETTTTNSWVSVSQFFNRVSFSYNNMDTWYYVQNVPVTAGTPITWRVSFDFPVLAQAKYDLCLYPSAYGTSLSGIQDANAAGNLYCLDPFINSTEYQIGNVSNSSNYWNTDMNSTVSNVTLSSDNKAFTLGAIGSSPAYTQKQAITSGDTQFCWNTASSEQRFYYLIDPNSNYSVDSLSFFIARSGANTGRTLRYSVWTTTGTPRLPDTRIAFSKESADVSAFSTAGAWVNLSFNYSSVNLSDVAGERYAIAIEPSSVGDASNAICVNRTASGANFYGYYNGASWTSSSPSQFDIAYRTFSCTSDCVVGFNTSKDTYTSNIINIAGNYTNFIPQWQYGGTGGVSINLTCNADAGSPSWTGWLTNNSVNVCSVSTGKLKYVINLSGTSTTSPSMQNLTLNFASNIAPTINRIQLHNGSGANYTSLSTVSPLNGAYYFNFTNVADADNATVQIVYSVVKSGVFAANNNTNVTVASLHASSQTFNLTSPGTWTYYANVTDGLATTQYSGSIVAINTAPTIGTLSVYDDTHNLESNLLNVSGEVNDALSFNFSSISDVDGHTHNISFLVVNQSNYAALNYSVNITRNSTYDSNTFIPTNIGSWNYTINITDGIGVTNYTGVINITNVAPDVTNFTVLVSGVAGSCTTASSCSVRVYMTEDGCALASTLESVVVKDESNTTVLEDLDWELTSEGDANDCIFRSNAFTPGSTGNFSVNITYTDAGSLSDTLTGTMEVTASQGQSTAGGGSGGGSGFAESGTASCGLNLTQPVNKEIRQVTCPSGKTRDGGTVMFYNPFATKATYSLEFVNITCDAVPPQVVLGKSYGQFDLTNCACPDSSDVAVGSVVISDSRGDACYTRIPVYITGTTLSGGQIILLIAGIVVAIGALGTLIYLGSNS